MGLKSGIICLTFGKNEISQNVDQDLGEQFKQRIHHKFRGERTF